MTTTTTTMIIYIYTLYIGKNGLSEKCGIPNALCHHFAHSNWYTFVNSDMSRFETTSRISIAHPFELSGLHILIISPLYYLQVYCMKFIEIWYVSPWYPRNRLLKCAINIATAQVPFFRESIPALRGDLEVHRYVERLWQEADSKIGSSKSAWK